MIAASRLNADVSKAESRTYVATLSMAPPQSSRTAAPPEPSCDGFYWARMTRRCAAQHVLCRVLGATDLASAPVSSCLLHTDEGIYKTEAHAIEATWISGQRNDDNT